MVIAHLAPGWTPSPWTQLEIAAALASERACTCTRLVIFVPDGSHGIDLFELGLAADLREQIGSRPIFTLRSVDELALLLRQSNCGPGPPPPGTDPASTAIRAGRKRDRLRATLAALGGDEVDSVKWHGPAAPPDAQVVRTYAQSILEECEVVEGGIGSPSYELYLFRNFVTLPDRKSLPCDRPTDESILATAALFADSSRSDDRANAYMLLEWLARFRGSSLASRYLRAALTQEVDWTVARCVMPDETIADHERQNRWPRRLLGVERKYLAAHEVSKQGILQDLKPLLAEAVRLRLTSKTGLRDVQLPDAYQVELELHWLAVIADFYEADPVIWGATLAEADAAGGGVEIELALRSAFEPLARILKAYECGESAESFERALNRSASSVAALVRASENNNGRPLSEFANYFVDWLLPLLGLIVQYGETPGCEALARRTIAVMAPHVPQFETDAYLAMVDDCVDARLCGAARGAMPVRIEFGRIRNCSIAFRALWDKGM